MPNDATTDDGRRVRKTQRWPWVHDRISITRGQWDRLEQQGKVPRRIRIGDRAVAWFEDEILDHVDKLDRERNAGAAPVVPPAQTRLAVTAPQFDPNAEPVWTEAHAFNKGQVVAAGAAKRHSHLDKLVEQGLFPQGALRGRRRFWTQAQVDARLAAVVAQAGAGTGA